MPVKVIFLDIDGVLNTNSDRNISDEKLIFLSELVSKTGAEIVLSSSWRNWWNHPKLNTTNSFITKWKLQFSNNHVVINQILEPEMPKTTAIEKYLTEYKPEKYVVLDDQVVFGTNLIQTNSDFGLTKEDCKKAAQLLK